MKKLLLLLTLCSSMNTKSWSMQSDYMKKYNIDPNCSSQIIFDNVKTTRGFLGCVSSVIYENVNHQEEAGYESLFNVCKQKKPQVTAQKTIDLCLKYQICNEQGYLFNQAIKIISALKKSILDSDSVTPKTITMSNGEHVIKGKF